MSAVMGEGHARIDRGGRENVPACRHLPLNLRKGDSANGLKSDESRKGVKAAVGWPTGISGGRKSEAQGRLRRNK